ncbi:alpha/beta fold hydrolase [Nocardioides mangrovi]|uniref:Alpha/beta hydrolase n=1 Tax=Nocardioides mangrovi TaxID=2874580 RepID=A0ABS7UEV3_9ACTN|nr:alpha/beta hydrolase [Nocardioides mangrovi]MBZ5739380.1 alpha/beta hydrolase [Nocardioides mangrovi]
MTTDRPGILLVHGAGGDPAAWQDVEPLLQQAGFRTRCVTNPLTSLAADLAHTTAELDDLAGPSGRVVAVGHSYGGAVITNVGRDDRVAALVYVAAFAPDEDESIDAICDSYPPAAMSQFQVIGEDGSWEIEDTEESRAVLSWDHTPELRARPRETRVCNELIFTEPTGVPGWRLRPSWYVVAADDPAIPPVAQRGMAARAGATTSEVPGTHMTPWLHPDHVARVIMEAAAAVEAVTA